MALPGPGWARMIASTPQDRITSCLVGGRHLSLSMGRGVIAEAWAKIAFSASKSISRLSMVSARVRRKSPSSLFRIADRSWGRILLVIGVYLRLELRVATQPLPGFSDDHPSRQPRPGRAQTLAVRAPEALRQRISTTSVDATPHSLRRINDPLNLEPIGCPRWGTFDPR